MPANPLFALLCGVTLVAVPLSIAVGTMDLSAYLARVSLKWLSYVILASLATYVCLMAGPIDAAEILACPAPVKDRWEHADLSQRAALAAALPATPCWMNFGNGGYLCERNKGCSRHNLKADKQ
jgi:hypothetical protein